MGDLSWNEFLSQAKQVYEISQELGDSWILLEKVYLIFGKLDRPKIITYILF